MMGVSGHRGYIPFEDRLKLIRKVPVMVALLCTGTRLTTGYRYTTLVDATCAFSAKQRTARSTTHPLDVLSLIEKFALRARTQRDAWAIRSELCEFRGSATALRKRARDLLRELQPPRTPKKGVRITGRPRGPWSLTITGESADVADMHSALDNERPLESVKSIFFGGKSGARTTATTQVIITLDELDRIVDGDGEEITLQLTNGSRIRGADFVTRVLSSHGYITLVHPVEAKGQGC